MVCSKKSGCYIRTEIGPPILNSMSILNTALRSRIFTVAQIHVNPWFLESPLSRASGPECGILICLPRYHQAAHNSLKVAQIASTASLSGWIITFEKPGSPKQRRLYPKAAQNHKSVAQNFGRLAIQAKCRTICHRTYTIHYILHTTYYYTLCYILYLERQVAQNNRPLFHKVAHK